MRSIYLGDPGEDRLTASHFCLILLYNVNTHCIFPNFWFHLLFPTIHRSAQFRGSSRPDWIVSSHLPMLLELNVEGM
jgi:hypothetical protein